MNTKKLANAVDKATSGETTPIFPESFLSGLRKAIDSGISCEQLTSILIVATGLHEALDSFNEHELLDRSKQIIEIIKGNRNLRVKCPRCRTIQTICWLDET